MPKSSDFKIKNSNYRSLRESADFLEETFQVAVAKKKEATGPYVIETEEKSVQEILGYLSESDFEGLSTNRAVKAIDRIFKEQRP